MEIICPECQFSREVDETKIPARSQVATCPKCKTKFQFRELPEEETFEVHPAEPATPEVEPEQPAAQQEAEEKAATKPTLAQGTLPIDEKPQQVDESPSVETQTPPVSKGEPKGNEALWDKLNRMAPPEERRKETPREEAVQPPVASEDEPVIRPMGDAYDQQTDQPAMQDAQPQQPEQSDHKPIPGWTGEFSNDFPDPMQDEEGEEDDQGYSPLVPPPFEQLDRYGFFHGLYMTIKLVLTSPRLFFNVMPVGGGLAKPLTFTILLTMIQGLVQYFWGVAGLSVSGAPDAEVVGGVSAALAPILMLLFMPALIAAGQFVITGIYHLLLIVMKADNQGFEGTFRALAYANAPIILGIFPMPMYEIEVVWMAIAAIWGLFLTITGLKHIHKTSYAKVIPVALIPLLLGMIVALAVFQGAMNTI